MQSAELLTCIRARAGVLRHLFYTQSPVMITYNHAHIYTTRIQTRGKLPIY